MVDLWGSVSGSNYGQSLTYSLLDHLGRGIVTGRYDKDGFPTEGELEKLHGVSRSVIRETVKMLTAKGLVTGRPRLGTIIQPTANWNLFDNDVLRWLLERQFSIDLLRQFNELRVGIEPQAAALAATAAQSDDLQRIEEGYARLEAADAGEDDSLAADIAFHVAVLRASGNPFYAQFRDVVTIALQASIRFTAKLRKRKDRLAHQGRVRDAIAAGDAEGARNAMELLIMDLLGVIKRSR